MQLLSALQASLRFLPNVVIGIMISFGTDAVLHKWDAYRYVTTMLLISCVAPLLMALMDPEWSYWYMAFWGMLRQTEFGMSAFLFSFVCRAIQIGKAGMSKTAITRRMMFWTSLMCDLLLAVTLESRVSSLQNESPCHFNLRKNI